MKSNASFLVPETVTIRSILPLGVTRPPLDSPVTAGSEDGPEEITCNLQGLWGDSIQLGVRAGVEAGLLGKTRS